jgi:hypothetical protein
MALAETGTRGLLGAALGSAAERDEPAIARRLPPMLRPGMLVLLDRAFDANAFLREVAATRGATGGAGQVRPAPVVLGHLLVASLKMTMSAPSSRTRPMRSVCWAGIPQLSARVRCCLAAWQQSRPYRTDANLPRTR